MYDKLILMLQKMAHPEVVRAYTQSLQVLEMYGYLDPWSDIGGYIESGPEVSTAVFMDVIEDILTKGLDHVLRQMTLMVDGNHEFMSQVLEGLKVLETYDDPESLLTIIDLQNSTLETLAEMLALVTPLKADDLLLKIVDCSEQLITAIRTTYQGKEALEAAPVPPEPSDKKRMIVSRILKEVPNCLAALAMNRDFMPYGLPIEVLLRKYTLELSLLQPSGDSVYDKGAPEQAGLEIIYLVCISDTAYEDIIPTVKSNLDTLYSDIEFITRINLTVDTNVSKVLAYGNV